MSDRKQFITSSPIRDDLKVALEKTKDVVVSDEQLREQRISFAYGNAPASSHSTKDEVKKAATSMLFDSML